MIFKPEIICKPGSVSCLIFIQSRILFCFRIVRCDWYLKLKESTVQVHYTERKSQEGIINYCTRC